MLNERHAKAMNHTSYSTWRMMGNKSRFDEVRQVWTWLYEAGRLKWLCSLDGPVLLWSHRSPSSSSLPAPVWQNNADDSDRGAAVHEQRQKEKQKQNKSLQRKETSEGIAQFQDWSVRFLRQKSSWKYQRTHDDDTTTSWFGLMQTHCMLLKKRINQGYWSRAFS